MAATITRNYIDNLRCMLYHDAMATKVKAISETDCCTEGESPTGAAAQGGTIADAATLFKALSDETRLRMVQAMARSQRQLCGGEIGPPFELSQAALPY